MAASWTRRNRPRWLVPVTLVSALAVVAGLVVGVRVLLTGWGPPPASSAGTPVAVHAVPPQPVKMPPMRPYHRVPVSWPAAQTATALIAAVAPGRKPLPLTAGSSAGSVRAGDLPVWVGPANAAAPGGRGRAVASASLPSGPVSRVQVAMASHATAAALGVRGVVFSLAYADSGQAGGAVHVSVSYSSFADAYGGDYASRLSLVELPSCALSTPQVPACRKQRPVPAGSADSVRAQRVGADVALPGTSTAAVLTSAISPSPSAVVLALMPATSGSGGNFGAEPLSEMSEWVNGGSSGAHTYSYPVQVPPVPGGLEPKVSLGYDSQRTDGLASSTNNQASSIGDGWDYSPGFIEQEYSRCPASGDLCAPKQMLTLSMNGTSSTMVVDTATTWRAEADGGAEIEKVGQYWKMTQPDGTQYYFGMNQLPGWAAGDPQTDSAWTVPVSSVFGTFPTNVWRWNLDYVVDTHGDAIAYFYNTQTNYYAENNGTAGTGGYTQGGVLARIEYGLRAGSIYGVTPAAQVTFTASTARQDAPDDLACASGAPCTVTSPSFWTDDALTGISTQALVNGSLQDVDSWALSDAYPATGDPTTSPSLWLASITRTGQDGPASIPLPPTSFAGTPMPGRVQTAADTAAGYSLITRFRLTSITSQTGGVTTIGYSGQDAACAAGNFPAVYANTTACYPDYWTPPGTSSQVLDWFNLYTAGTVTEKDTTGGSPPVVTGYTFSGAAWHADDDTISRSATATWDQWRGYRTVTTETGTAPDPVTEQADTYLQGMSGDASSCSGLPCTTTVSVTSTRGDTVTDSDELAGMLFESIVYDGAGTGSEVTDTVNVVSGALTATDSNSGISAYMAEEPGTRIYTALAGGGTRESTVTNTYDSYGRVTQEQDVPDTTDPAQDTCTSTTYNTDTTNWVLDQVAQVEVRPNSSCANDVAAISITNYTYDTAGDPKQIQKAVTASNAFGATYTYVTQNATYDEYGRVLTATDPDNRTTSTVYTPATGAEPTSVQVTDPAGLVTTTTYDPARDLPLTITDPAGYVTADAYDALGRVTAKWTPGNPASGPAVDQYSYAVSNTAPSVVTEQAEEPGGGYLTTEALSDSLGRTRETQTQTASGGSDITDVSYNSDGLKALTSSPYYTSAAPSGTLVGAASTSVPSQTGYVYDGAGRVVKQIDYALGTETWETDTTYGGNYTTTVPPAGGASSTTFTDGRGLTTAIYQYHTGVPASPSDPASDYDKTSYTYTPAQKLATITDAAGNAWSYTYDMVGDQLTQTNPDAGNSTNTYDNAQQLMSVTDARGKTISYTYDPDGRKTAEYDTTGGVPESTATQLASWTWDTVALGKLTSSTAFEGGTSYTEQVTGYGTYGLPSGTQTVIPSAQGALAGTYTTRYTYAPTGQLTSYEDSAAGGLPDETVTTGYDTIGEADSLTGASSYVDSLSYTHLGQLQQYTMGTSAEPAYITDSWDPQTGRLTEQNTQIGTAQTSIDDLHYGYDQAGNITSEADAPAGASSATDVQCFRYDYLGRLTQAWAQPGTGCAATPSASAEGGAAPYWNTYAYDVAGNLTSITATTPSGSVTTTTDTYPAPGSARPHAITTAAVTTSSDTTSTSYGYDPSGNTQTITSPSQDQALTWNDAGQLAQDAVTPQGGTTSQNTTYVYDADHTLLITTDPGTTTLYLPDEELSLSTGTGTVTGTRYYSINGTTIATRTGTSTVAFLAGDQQGTDSAAIDSQALNVTRRYYDPYGNPRGSTASNFPAGQKGFVGGTADTATGLTNLGAREYQPGTGSFISPDPVLKPYQPWDLNPYAYAKDSPATFSDPTGKDPCDGIRNPQLFRDCEINESRLQQSQACPGNGTTAGGQGQYYKNVTPICGPPQTRNDDQPFNVTGWWGKHIENRETDQQTLISLDGVIVGLDAKGYGLAADLVGHYLDRSGTPVQVDPAQMRQDDPLFKAQVQAQINKCEARGQVVCNSGWLFFSDENEKNRTRAENYWYYALGSWNFDVTGYKDTSGRWHFTVNVFKYYKWGNPNGGVPRPDICAPGAGKFWLTCINQNDVAQLNADGLARNFDVWGTYNIPDGSG